MKSLGILLLASLVACSAVPGRLEGRVSPGGEAATSAASVAAPLPSAAAVPMLPSAAAVLPSAAARMLPAEAAVAAYLDEVTPGPTVGERAAVWGARRFVVAAAGGETAAADGETAASGGAADMEALARQVQNPVADLISLPFQNNTNFGVGPGNDAQNILNIQPVIPVDLGDKWILITRTILPVVYQPKLTLTGSDDFGLGDTTFTGFFSPKGAGSWIWGVGPVILLPTSTGATLGAGEWGLGASAVALTISGPWVAGVLVNNVWSFGGDVNQFLLQYFVNYNLPDGWYLTSAPIITANWDASRCDRWTIPFGAGVGKIFKIGKQAMNASIQVYYNVDRPAGGPEWQLRLQLQFLFPKKKT